MRYISEGLENVTTLEKLQFDRNGLGPQGVQFLSEIIKKNSLVEFIIFENEIQDEGVEKICEALKSNTTLKTLTLGGEKKFIENCQKSKLHQKVQSPSKKCFKTKNC
jgi:Ran GTPase-activating protein (RanGAP) involved in mRNA processing and transport